MYLRISSIRLSSQWSVVGCQYSVGFLALVLGLFHFLLLCRANDQRPEIQSQRPHLTTSSSTFPCCVGRRDAGPQIGAAAVTYRSTDYPASERLGSQPPSCQSLYKILFAQKEPAGA